MSNAEPLPQTAQIYRQGRPRGALAARAPFSPLIEHALLFTFFAGGAGFRIAVIWWILR